MFVLFLFVMVVCVFFVVFVVEELGNLGGFLCRKKFCFGVFGFCCVFSWLWGKWCKKKVVGVEGVELVVFWVKKVEDKVKRVKGKG